MAPSGKRCRALNHFVRMWHMGSGGTPAMPPLKPAFDAPPLLPFINHRELLAKLMTISHSPFDSRTILEGIRHWVEIETPTEAPDQVNRLATLVADGYRGLDATIERIPGRDGCGDHL